MAVFYFKRTLFILVLSNTALSALQEFSIPREIDSLKPGEKEQVDNSISMRFERTMKIRNKAIPTGQAWGMAIDLLNMVY